MTRPIKPGDSLPEHSPWVFEEEMSSRQHVPHGWLVRMNPITGRKEVAEYRTDEPLVWREQP